MPPPSPLGTTHGYGYQPIFQIISPHVAATEDAPVQEPSTQLRRDRNGRAIARTRRRSPTTQSNSAYGTDLPSLLQGLLILSPGSSYTQEWETVRHDGSRESHRPTVTVNSSNREPSPYHRGYGTSHYEPREFHHNRDQSSRRYSHHHRRGRDRSEPISDYDSYHGSDYASSYESRLPRRSHNRTPSPQHSPHQHDHHICRCAHAHPSSFSDLREARDYDDAIRLSLEEYYHNRRRRAE